MRKLVLAIAALAAWPALAQTEAPAAKWFEKITPFGYAKAGYFFVTPAQEDALIGARNGFRLANLRLGVSLKPVDKLEVVASIDGSMARRNESDPLDGNRVVELKDAYVEWSASRYSVLRIGQFKAPFDAEELSPDDQLPFISRSVVTEGVMPPEGYPQTGMTLERQVGVQLSSQRLGSEAAGFRYELAVVNGNGPNVLNNDSGVVAPVARLSYLYRDLLTVGVNGFFSQRTEGERPNRIRSSHLGYGGDLSVRVGGLSALAMVLMRNTTHPSSGLPSQSALGLMGQLHYLHSSGVEGGVRFASYEPSSVVPDDRLTQGAAMVGYRLSSVPLRLLVQYTLRLEESAVSVGNDSVDMMAQVSW